MGKYFFLAVMLCFSLHVSGQADKSPGKPVIDSAALATWGGIGMPYEVRLSNDGHYVSYVLNEKGKRKRVLQSLTSARQVIREFPDASDAFFSGDSRHFIACGKNAITDLDIQAGTIRQISNVKSMTRVKTRDILCYQLNGSRRELVLRFLQSNKELRLPLVNRFVISDSERKMVVASIDSARSPNYRLQLVDLEHASITDVDLTGVRGSIEKFAMDNTGDQLVLMSREMQQGKPAYAIWYFDPKTGGVRLLVDGSSTGIAAGERVTNRLPSFTGDGRYIFFQVETPVLGKPDPLLSKVDVWGYRDQVLQSLQLRNTSPSRYTFTVGLAGGNIVRLESASEKLKLMPFDAIRGDFAIVVKENGDRFWEDGRTDSASNVNWMVSLKDGSRTPINAGNNATFFYSPDNRYLVFFSYIGNRPDYYSMDLATGRTINISGRIPLGKLIYDDSKKAIKDKKVSQIGIAAWIPGEAAVLVYDNFDIWKLSLGKAGNPPVNLTNGYGERNGLRLRITDRNEGEYLRLGGREKLLLTAFNWKSKENGFYSKSLQKQGDPDSLSMRPWTVCLLGKSILPINDEIDDKGMFPIKARDRALWVVQVHSPSEAPNYFTTSDFVSYQRVTNVQPQARYNWYTTELVKWKQYDGTQGEGVLYKPENFDPGKKYPLIIYQYRLLSQRLNAYLQPQLMYGPINIPWLVSRGYLVLTPDVDVTPGKGSGPDAYNSVASAAAWAGGLPFVDKDRIGLNGHSRGGFQTNYIIAHSDLFAAAYSGAGGADAISSAFGLAGLGGSRLKAVERSQGILWDNPEVYLENAPILRADKIRTPLLIFHCKADGAVPWELSLQLFTALRRLERPVWMLQYDEGDHVVSNERDQRDLTIRVTQFFDHYLKGAKPPVWMSQGIPATSKGISSGLELDQKGLR